MDYKSKFMEIRTSDHNTSWVEDIDKQKRKRWRRFNRRHDKLDLQRSNDNYHYYNYHNYNSRMLRGSEASLLHNDDVHGSHDCASTKMQSGTRKETEVMYEYICVPRFCKRGMCFSVKIEENCHSGRTDSNAGKYEYCAMWIPHKSREVKVYTNLVN